MERTIEDDVRLRDAEQQNGEQVRRANAMTSVTIRRASEETTQRRASKSRYAGLIAAIDACIC